MDQNRRASRYMALVLSFAMAIGFHAKVFAEEPGVSGNINEALADEAESGMETDDVFRAVLPTDTENVFDFIMDPQQLINQTGAAAYDGKAFEENATLFFERSDGAVEEDYSSTSDSVTIANEGTADLDISLTVTMDPQSIEGITMTDDREFTGDGSTSLYLARLMYLE